MSEDAVCQLAFFTFWTRDSFEECGGLEDHSNDLLSEIGFSQITWKAFIGLYQSTLLCHMGCNSHVELKYPTVGVGSYHRVGAD